MSVETTRLLFTIPEACQALGIGRTQLYALMDHGELPSVHIGTSRRIAFADVVAFVERLRASAMQEESTPAA